SYGQLTPNHAILGPGVALNVDQTHIGLHAFVNSIDHIDRAGASRKNLGNSEHIDVPAGTIEIAQSFQIVPHTLGCKERTIHHFQAGPNFIRRNDVYPFQPGGVNPILDALNDRDIQLNSGSLERHGLHVGDFRIGEAAVLIECPNGQAIFLHLSGAQSSASVNEGQNVPRTRLHDLDQVSFSDALVAKEIDSPDDQAWSLGDLEKDADLVGSGDLLDAILHVDFREVAILVDFQYLLAIRF